jgi:quinol monooxygenase YgiN
MITRINHFEAKPGRGSDLRQFLASVIATIRSSPGCQSVQLLQSTEHSERFAIIEVWDSIEAHQAAARVIPPAKLQEVLPLLVTPATGAYFRPV